MRILTLVAALVLAPSTASAQTDPNHPLAPLFPPLVLPDYDVEADCRVSGLNVGVCIAGAQEWYDRAKFYWPLLSDESKAFCLPLAEKQKGSAVRHARYQILGSCASTRYQYDEVARVSKNPPRFQR